MRPYLLPLLAIAVMSLCACPNRSKPAPTRPGDKAAPATDKPAPAAPSAAQCKLPDDCMLRVKGCCGPCQETALSQMEALTLKQHKAREKACVGVQLRCSECKQPGYNANYLTLCREGRCLAQDIREMEFSACKQDKDCRITSPACCNCYLDPVAVSLQGDPAFHRWACPKNLHCGACEMPQYRGLKAVCQAGHCVLQGSWDKTKEEPHIRGFLGVKDKK